MDETVFDSTTRQTISALRTRFDRLLASESAGAFQARSIGRGREFHDHRAYLPGDDLRDVDWNLYGRLDELHVKRYRAEADLDVRIMVDRSGSMTIGRSSKLLFALRLAGALAAILADEGRSLELRLLEPGLPRIGPRVLSEAQVEPLFSAIEDIEPLEGAADIGAGAAELSASRNRLAILISDLMDADTDLPRLLSARAPRCQLDLVALLAPEELRFRETGRISFEDAESSGKVEMVVNEAMVTAYHELLEARLEAIESRAQAQGAAFVLLESDAALERACLAIAARGGLGR